MKKYSGFTLIEMLIVMGIIIVLMAAGIAGGRFALQRANRIQKISAVDNIEQALWGYYSDNRKFPSITGTAIPPKTLMTQSQYLGDYIDAGQFDGGSAGTFWYFTDDIGQEFVVCGSLGGVNDEMGQGIYCNGNGISSGNVAPFNVPGATVSDNIYMPDGGGGSMHQMIINATVSASNWNGDTRTFE
jgi:prepilin-type N-terminal cleavage/methylation domain-containing protein